MQKISGCIFSEDLLVEQMSWNKTPGQFDALPLGVPGLLGQWAHPEGGISRVACNPSHSGKRPAGFTRQIFRRVKLGAIGTGASCCAAGTLLSSLKQWDVAHCHRCPRVKLRVKLGEIRLFWKVSLSISSLPREPIQICLCYFCIWSGFIWQL